MLTRRALHVQRPCYSVELRGKGLIDTVFAETVFQLLSERFLEHLLAIGAVNGSPKHYWLVVAAVR